MKQKQTKKRLRVVVPLERLVMCEDRLPSEDGEYRVKNNSGCNNGKGVLDLIDGGWDIPEEVRSFYRVIGWYENI